MHVIHGVSVLRLMVLLLCLAGSFLPVQARAEEQTAAAASRRHIPLAGANNFRDLGGYVTADGRRVRYGKLYRSDNLSQLSERDWATLRSLGITTIADFRSPQEVAAYPPRQPADMRLVALPISTPNIDFADLRRRVLAGDLSTLPVLDGYTDFAFAQSQAYRDWMAMLLDGQTTASVFHCTSGKDRTGLGAALLLTALGVSRETVLEDYTASNFYLHDSIERAIDRIRQSANFNGDDSKLRAVLGVHREQLEKTLAAIEAKHGSIDNYLEVILGVGKAERERLRALFLEPT